MKKYSVFLEFDDGTPLNPEIDAKDMGELLFYINKTYGIGCHISRIVEIFNEPSGRPIEALIRQELAPIKTFVHNKAYKQARTFLSFYKHKYGGEEIIEKIDALLASPHSSKNICSKIEHILGKTIYETK